MMVLNSCISNRSMNAHVIILQSNASYEETNILQRCVFMLSRVAKGGMYVCMYVCIHICMYVCMYVYIYIYSILRVDPARLARPLRRERDRVLLSALKMHQRGVQWKQGVVIYIML